MTYDLLVHEGCSKHKEVAEDGETVSFFVCVGMPVLREGWQ